MSISTIEKHAISDERLEERLLSLRQEDSPREQPPVVNTFRLEMESERRRNKRQVQIAAVAAWCSVTATLAVGDALAMVLLDMHKFSIRDYAENHPAGAIGRALLLPQMEKHFSPEAKFFIAQIKQSVASYSAALTALGIAFLVGSLFSGVLLIAKRDILFTKNN